MKQNRTALRTVEILELIAKKKELTLSEIAKSLDIPSSSAYDIIHSLVEKNMIEISDERLKTYRLGVNNLFLGNAFIQNTDIIALSAPFLKDLSERTGNTVFLGKLSGARVTFMHKHEPSDGIVSTCKIGTHANLSNTALGKIMLAYNDELRKRVLSLPLSMATKHSIIDPIALENNLREAKDNGYAIDQFEHDERILCIAFPIFDSSGKVEHSISISGFAHDSRNTQLEIALGMEAAAKISEKIGHKN